MSELVFKELDLTAIHEANQKISFEAFQEFQEFTNELAVILVNKIANAILTNNPADSFVSISFDDDANGAFAKKLIEESTLWVKLQEKVTTEKRTSRLTLNQEDTEQDNSYLGKLCHFLTINFSDLDIESAKSPDSIRLFLELPPNLKKLHICLDWEV